jgi:hypothetical protein
MKIIYSVNKPDFASNIEIIPLLNTRKMIINSINPIRGKNVMIKENPLCRLASFLKYGKNLIAILFVPKSAKEEKKRLASVKTLVNPICSGVRLMG